jgi:hypothetical protein
MILTALQMTEIFFQHPERISKNVLEKRTALARLRDKFFYLAKSGHTELWQGKLCKDWFLSLRRTDHFNLDPHPRNLDAASFELKALGFSNTQIDQLKLELYRFILTNSQHSTWYKESIMPHESFQFDDRCFLGCASYSIENEKAVGNSIFQPNKEEVVFQECMGHFSCLQKNKPDLFATRLNKKILSENKI